MTESPSTIDLATPVHTSGLLNPQSAMNQGRPAPKQHRVLVTGSREWNDLNLIEQALNGALALLQVPITVQDRVTLIHGAANGLDSMAAQVAGTRGWKIESYPAKWNEHTAACPEWHTGASTCKMAGHRRNHEMIALGADLVIAFPMGDEASGQSKGTWGCAKAAMKAELPTVVLWKESFYPWGPQAEQLVLAERRATFKDPALHTKSPAKLDTLLPIPF